MKNGNTENELVIMAPVQIKYDLSVGNIFDLTLIDFYVKTRKLLGINVYSPFLWNINGEPIVKQIIKDGAKFTAENVENYIVTAINRAKEKLKEHFINFDIFLRDDQILYNIEELAKTKYFDTFNIDTIKLSKCSKCGMIFGSDPSIKICKFCGSIVNYIEKRTLFKIIKKGEVLNKIGGIIFYPVGVKKKLIDFIDKLPDEYNLVLEKERLYTLKYKEIKLDPRFITMLFPAILKSGDYKQTTWIHGDVVKKFDYYSLCYLNAYDCPDKIISHGLILGEDKKKVRWQNNDNSELRLLDYIDSKILRAYFLKHNINTNIVINFKNIQIQTRGLVKLYVKIKRILEKRNLDLSKRGIRADLNYEVDRFYKNLELFKFSEAFNNMQNYADSCWRITKNQKLSEDETKILLNLKNIYFGE